METKAQTFYNQLFEQYSCGAIEPCREALDNIDNDMHNHGETTAARMVIEGERDFKLEELGNGVFSWYLKSRVNRHNLDYRESAACMLKAWERLPGNVYLMEKAAEACQQAGVYQKAGQLYKKLLESAPGSVAYMRNIALTSYQNEDYSGCLNWIKKIPNWNADPELQEAAGFSFYKLGQYGAAVRLLESLPGRVELPDFKDIKKKVPAPEKLLEEARRDQSVQNDPEWQKNLGFSYLFHDNYEKAIATFESLKKTLLTERIPRTG